MTQRERTEHAVAAWQRGRRTRAVGSAIDRTADGALASGGLLVANAMLQLNLGLPAGRAGVTLGSSLLCAAIAWMTRGRRRTVLLPQRTVSARIRMELERAA